MNRHLREAPNITCASRVAVKEVNNGVRTRRALNDVTFTAVNRQDTRNKTIIGQEDETSLIRDLSNTGTSPPSPSRSQTMRPAANAINPRTPLTRAWTPTINDSISQVVPRTVVVQREFDISKAEHQREMDVEGASAVNDEAIDGRSVLEP